MKKYIVIINSDDGYDIERFETLIEAVEFSYTCNRICEVVKMVDFKIKVDEFN